VSYPGEADPTTLGLLLKRMLFLMSDPQAAAAVLGVDFHHPSLLAASAARVVKPPEGAAQPATAAQSAGKAAELPGNAAKPAGKSAKPAGKSGKPAKKTAKPAKEAAVKEAAAHEQPTPE